MNPCLCPRLPFRHLSRVGDLYLEPTEEVLQGNLLPGPEEDLPASDHKLHLIPRLYF